MAKDDTQPEGGAADAAGGGVSEAAAGGGSPTLAGGSPAGASPDDDVLRRAARVVREDASLAAWRPFTGAERASLVDAALARVDAEAASTSAAHDELAARRRRRLPWVWASAAAALAAAVLLYMTRARVPEIAPLVAYALRVEGEMAQRGDPSAPSEGRTEVRPGTRLTATLAPAAGAPERDALLRVLLVRGGTAALLEVPVTRTPDGQLRVEGLASELLGPQADGAAELVVVLGRQLPDDDTLRAMVTGGQVLPAHLQVLRRPLVLLGFSHGAVEVWLGGCRHVAIGAAGPRGPPRCEVAGGATLVLWIGVAGGAQLDASLDGVPQRGRGEAVHGGVRLEVAPGSARVLSVAAGGRELGRWELAPAHEPAGVVAFDAAWAQGRIEAAATALAAVPGDAPEVEQLEVMRRRAKLARVAGRADEERALREQAVALAARLGRVSAQADETVAILYGLLGQHAFGRAVELLRTLEEPARLYPEGAVRRSLVAGLLAAELGDLGAARVALGRAVELAERVRDERDKAVALGPLADVLQALGRFAEADAAIEAELVRGASATLACDRVDALTNGGWLLREHAAARARQLVAQAVDLAEDKCPRLVPIARLNAAWLDAAAGDYSRARAALDELAALPGATDSRIVTWRLRLEGELILAEDPARAEVHARALAARAERLCSSELGYEAHLLHARAQAARGRDATASFLAAERELARWSRLVPLGEGRATFFARHEQLAAAAVPFLAARVRAAAPGAELALAATVRRSVARFAASLAAGGRARVAVERGQWQGSAFERYERTVARWPGGAADQRHVEGAVEGVCAQRAAIELDDDGSTTPPASAALLVHPLPSGLLLVVWQGAKVRVHELAATAAEPATTAATVAQLAASELRGAPRVALYVHRTLAALPLDRELSRALDAPAFYAIDAAGAEVRRSPPRAAPCAGPPRAALVTNPQQNLWHASASASASRERLVALGYQVVVLDGAAATRKAVLSALLDPCVALLVYEGHGRAGALATADRSDDALLLAGGEPLTAAEVLELDRAPPAVILHGCTTAAVEGLGLAQAFVLAGSSQVLASPVELRSEAAARWSTRLAQWREPAARQPDLAALVTDAPAHPMRWFAR